MKLRTTLICSLPLIMSIATFVTGTKSHTSFLKDIKFSSELSFEKGIPKHKLLLNMNGLPLVSKSYEMYKLFHDKACITCIPCMNKAIIAKTKEMKLQNLPESIVLQNHTYITPKASQNRNLFRKKRFSDNPDAETEYYKKDKKPKSKKSIVVTKYTLQGNIHAVKVKETRLDDMQSTCEVFSVTNSYACQSPEGESLMVSGKKNKRKKERTLSTTENSITKTEKSVTKVNYRKRDTSRLSSASDYSNMQMPENVMPSFEEYF